MEFSGTIAAFYEPVKCLTIRFVSKTKRPNITLIPLIKQISLLFIYIVK